MNKNYTITNKKNRFVCFKWTDEFLNHYHIDCRWATVAAALEANQ